MHTDDTGSRRYLLQRLAADTRAAVGVEYLVLVGCVALAGIAAWQQFGGAINDKALCQSQAVLSLSSADCSGDAEAIALGTDVDIAASDSAEDGGEADQCRSGWRGSLCRLAHAGGDMVRDVVGGLPGGDFVADYATAAWSLPDAILQSALPLFGAAGEGAPGVVESWAATGKQLTALGCNGIPGSCNLLNSGVVPGFAEGEIVQIQIDTGKSFVGWDYWASGEYGTAAGTLLPNIALTLAPGPKVAGLGRAARATHGANDAPRARGDTDSENAWMHGELEIVDRKKVGMGINGAEIITVRDPSGATHTVIWKNAESERRTRPGLEAGTYHQREGAMYELDRALGGDVVVPPAVSRRLGDEQGSMHAFVPDTQPTVAFQERFGADALDPARLSQNRDYRRMFLLDVIGGNGDRNPGNAMWQMSESDLRVFAIDNGLTFPKHWVPWFKTPTRSSPDHLRDMLRLDDESVRLVRGLPLDRAAEVLRRQPGITPKQIENTLGRIRALQNNPEAFSKLADSRYPKIALLRWLSRSPNNRPELTPADRAEIARLAGVK